ncbi:NAD-dependent epimerase/dehydratase family protein [Vagococcus salmoninarum]|uniref:NAD-dependent epimerase/dehydratase family protein n=1 Tax=Vagococcus salmoninarum TaxID=2739 RepID=UPI003F9DE4A9
MKCILITGGAGFIGSTIANTLCENNQVIIVDDLSMGKLSNLKKSKNITFIEGSVTDPELMESLISQNDFNYIYHFAAIASVADSVARPLETHQVNFESVLSLLETIKKHNKKPERLIFSSSAAVYGDEETLPKAEESVIRPLTPYAIDKFAAEKYVLSYSQLYGIATSAVRFFNVYGPNQNPESPYSGVISILIDRYEKLLKTDESSFTIFGDGEQTRDFVYIEDVEQALNLICRKEEAIGEVYNVATGIETSLAGLIEMMDQTLETKLPLIHEPARRGDIPASYADISKLESLGFKNNYTVKEGIRKYLETIM